MATQAEFVRTALRADPSDHARIHELAKASGRTFNAELNVAIKAHIAANAVAKPSTEITLSDADVDRIAMRIVQLMKTR